MGSLPKWQFDCLQRRGATLCNPTPDLAVGDRQARHGRSGDASSGAGEAMSATVSPTAITTPRTQDEWIELANQLFREFHTRCFWHSPRALFITEDLILFVVKG